MKHISIVLALSVLGINASSAILPHPTVEKPAFSAEKPETSLAATQAQFIYHPGFYIVLFKGKAVKVIVK